MRRIAQWQGVEVYYIPTDKFKTSSINITFCDNMSREHAYRNALLPSVLCRGTKDYPSARALSAKLQLFYGAELSTSVDKRGELQLIQFVGDFVDSCYAGQADLEEAFLRLFLDVILRPHVVDGGFVDSYVQQEIQNNDDTIRSVINDKQNYAILRGQDVMCEGEPYGMSELGEIGDGAHLNGSNLYDYYQNVFLRTLPVKIFYCGRKEPTKLLKLLAEHREWLDCPRISLRLGYLEKKKPTLRQVKEEFDVTQGKLTIGFRTNVPPESSDFFALAVCNGIFGAGIQSKLFQVVREKYSLAYYAASRLDRFKGVLVAYSGIECAKKEQTQALILEQIEEIKRGNISQEELQGTLQMFANRYRSYKDTQFALMDFYLGQSFLPEGKTIDSFSAALLQVTRDDVIRVAQGIVPDTVYFLAQIEPPCVDGFAAQENYRTATV